MKRLIVCADGTWNMRDQKDDDTGRIHPTNVTKVARAIKPRASDGTDQVVIYHDGVGTHPGLDKWTGGATGEGIEPNIRELYRSILYNFADGDELFLFGFSRGAFTARTLAGFMGTYGLLKKSDDFFVPMLFDCYRTGKTPAEVRADVNFRRMSDPQSCPSLKFIGVWDTVGALGLPGDLGGLIDRGRFKYHNIELNPNIQHAYHALAIDERRGPFAPSIWTRPEGWNGTLEQTWFCGVHCNVGGGYDPDGLANEALHWMVEKAEGQGLELDNEYLRHFRPCFDAELHDSMTWKYRPFPEFVRPVGQHLSHGEQLHQSVIDRLKKSDLGYAPKNLPQALLTGSTALPVVNTTRVTRGTPCGPMQKHPLAVQ